MNNSKKIPKILMKSKKTYSKKIVNKAEELLQWYFNLTDHLTYMQALECVQKLIEESLKHFPMYTGDLNREWKYWNEMKEYINEQIEERQ